MTLLLVVLGLVVVVNCCFMGYLISDVTAHSKSEKREPGNVIWLGVITFFQFILSFFGIPHFATGIAAYSQLKWVSVKNLPGTMIVSSSIPVAIMAIICITSIKIDIATLIVPIVAQVAGAYFTPRVALKTPVKFIRLFLIFGMFITALRFAAESFGVFPAGGTVTALGVWKLSLLGFLCLFYGALHNFGIGSFVPTMVTVYALGLSPEAAFPIMMGTAAFSMPAAGIRFVQNGSYSRKIAVVTAICGTAGVLAAAFLIKNVNISPLKWLAAVFLLYCAGSMFIAALKGKEDSAAELKPQKNDGKMSVVGQLTSFCLALILICTVSLVFIFVINLHKIASKDVETRVSEHTTRIRDNVSGYLSELEKFTSRARSGAARLMSDEPADVEKLREYLVETANARSDVSLLYCTTNERWNGPGGYAAFSRQWDVPQEWDNTERPWFTDAKNARGKIAYSEPYLDAFSGDIILGLSANIYDDSGRDIGVIAVDIAIETVNAIIQSSASIEGQQVFLIDGNGIFVAHPDKAMAARGNFFEEAGLEKHRSGILSPGQFFTTDKGVAVYSSLITAAGWYVVSTIPTKSVYASVNEPIFGIFLAPMLIVIFMLFTILISLTIIMRQQRNETVMMEQLNEELKIASKSKSDFLAAMSHEMRTPMNVIIGIAQIQLQKGGLPDGYSAELEKIFNAGSNLLGIMNDILDVSKVETGKLKLIPVEYDTPSLINDAVQFNIVRIGSKQVDFILDVDESLPSKLYGDELRLKQILNNLLSNAFKYTDAGSVNLSISHVPQGADTILRFAVKDTGQGIKPEDQKRLFSEFVRFNVRANRATEGTGLGLSITKRLVAIMDGAIEVESEYGKGSAFTVTVKQKTVACGPIGAETASKLRDFTFMGERRSSAFRIARQPMPYGKVLVVDDIDTNLYVAAGLLSPYRLKIETVRSGFEAIDRVERGETYDVIFMDHMMPEMDGVEATRRLRAMGYGGVIVALTANALTGNDKIFMQNGFDSFVSKPIDVQELDNILREFVSGRHPEEAEKYKHEDVSVQPPASEMERKLRRIFCRDAEAAVTTIRETLASGDVKLFTTTVHAMKSALANVGEHAASKLAHALEDAGNGGDAGLIAANAEGFVKTLQSIAEKLAQASAESIAPADVTEDRAYLAEQLEIAAAACGNYDDGAVYAALGRLKEKPWRPRTADAIEKIYDALFLNSDFDGAAELARALKTEGLKG